MQVVKAATKLARKKETKIMNPQVTETENTSTNERVYTKTVKSKVENPITGKKIEAEGTFTLPLAVTLDDMLAMEKQKESEVAFWYNYGRQVAARSQVN